MLIFTIVWAHKTVDSRHWNRFTSNKWCMINDACILKLTEQERRNLFTDCEADNFMLCRLTRCTSSCLDWSTYQDWEVPSCFVSAPHSSAASAAGLKVNRRNCRKERNGSDFGTRIHFSSALNWDFDEGSRNLTVIGELLNLNRNMTQTSSRRWWSLFSL